MATFVVLASFTDQGIRSVKDTAKRAKGFRDAAAGLGIKIKDILWTLGTHDVVVTFEAKNDEDATALMLKVGALGNLKSQTLRAFNESEISAITGRI